jgi:hypothetical protein
LLFRPDDVYVTTTFHGRIKEAKFDHRIFGGIIAGIFLLLAIIIIILWKVKYYAFLDSTAYVNS